jgi:thiol-disulfide isomerase/thioredoxin
MSNIKMGYLYVFAVTSVFLMASAALFGAGQGDATNPPESSPKLQVVDNLYPGLTMGALAEARVSQLPKGTLLKAATFTIRESEVNEEIDKAAKEIRPQLRKNAFFVLEQMARSKLLQAEVRNKAAESGKSISEENEDAMIGEYLRSLLKTVKVTEAEIQDFYSDNTDMLGNTPLARIRPQIEQFLLQQKQQEFITKHIQAIGRKMQVTISAPWLAVQVSLVRDNPVDKARASGRPSLADFGSTDCIPCQMMAPILDTLKKKYEGKLNVLFVHVQEEPILASRYGVQSIPVQVFFDKDGREVYRHVGFLAQSEIEKRLSEIGVE